MAGAFFLDKPPGALFPPAQNLSLGLRYLLLTHSWLKCHTADATASGGAAPVTIPSSAQWVPFPTSCTCYRFRVGPRTSQSFHARLRVRETGCTGWGEPM